MMMNFEQKIAKVLLTIPEVWPLAQMVAVNPLEDMTQLPIKRAMHKMEQTTASTLTLSLSDYYAYLLSGEISEKSLLRAIEAYLAENLPKKELDEYGFELSTVLLHYVKDKTTEESESFESYCEDESASAKDIRKWLANYHNDECMVWQRLKEGEGFYAYWRRHASHINQQWAQFLETKAEDPKDVVKNYVEFNETNRRTLQFFLENICWQLKGWVGYIKWQEQHVNHPWAKRNISIYDYIAVWICYEEFHALDNKERTTNRYQKALAYIQHDVKSQVFESWQTSRAQFDHNRQDDIYKILQMLPLNELDIRWIWQYALEHTYQSKLLAELSATRLLKSEKTSTRRVEAQWVFCIDVRSEGLRYQLEKNTCYETFGMAGFFGLVTNIHDEKHNRITAQCPVLLEPELVIKLIDHSLSFMQSCKNILERSIYNTKYSTMSAFALYEFVGIWYAIKLYLKNYLTKLDDKTDNHNVSYDLSSYNKSEAAGFLSDMLKSMGLDKNLADIVVLCAHGAETTNNPFHATLDCGACGGNAGLSNAIIVSQLLNDETVREQLVTHGIVIPETTRFIPASHNTTADEIYWFDDTVRDIDSLKERIDRVKKDTREACLGLQAQRMRYLPGDSKPATRAKNWAELMPEWGLCNNAAMIIGPRSLTRGVNLKQRVFLCSYNPAVDDDSLLEAVLMGPMRVAHWINMQYFFSTVNPQVYGSGNKALHNVIANVGVMEGNDSDLKIGLPKQSVFYQDKRMHTPQRLLVVIYARRESVEAIINKHDKLKQLVDGKWLNLIVCEPNHAEEIDKVSFF